MHNSRGLRGEIAEAWVVCEFDIGLHETAPTRHIVRAAHDVPPSPQKWEGKAKSEIALAVIAQRNRIGRLHPSPVFGGVETSEARS